MKLDLDPSYLRSCMRLWRDSIDLKLPMADVFKLHMMQQRETILTNFESTASAWLMALRRAVPDADSKTDFDNLISEIEAFEACAKAGLKEISDMAMHEAVQGGIEDLLSDPIAAEAFRELAKRLRPPDPDSA
jgi:hypothetical protein